MLDRNRAQPTIGGVLDCVVLWVQPNLLPLVATQLLAAQRTVTRERKVKIMGAYYDEVEIEDMVWDEVSFSLFFPPFFGCSIDSLFTGKTCLPLSLPMRRPLRDFTGTTQRV